MIVANSGRDITSCAHGCLSMPGCLSFNFGEDVSLCELNNSSSTRHLQDFTVRPGFVYGHWITLAVIQYVFTTLGAEGPLGPNNTSGYVGTSLEGKVQLNNGIQEWTVPYTGMYFIEVFGASGANGTCANCSGWKHGGLGARIAGLFELRLGQKLKILVGQQGQVNFYFPEHPGGGGGGTFVTLMDNSPLLIAEGGGGGSISSLDGDPGQAGQNGTRNGGASGSGGQTNPGISSGTGAGLWGDGEGIFGQARSFRSGGQSAYTLASLGGFGGGGYGLVLPGGGRRILRWRSGRDSRHRSRRRRRLHKYRLRADKRVRGQQRRWEGHYNSQHLKTRAVSVHHFPDETCQELFAEDG